MLFGFKTLTDNGVASVGIDAQFGAFEVKFHRGTTFPNRLIGFNAKAMQKSNIQGGQVIAQCHVTGTERVEGIRLTTNKGWQMIIGKDGPNAQSLVKEHKGKVVVEFYDTWADYGTLQETLISFGVFTLDLMIGVPELTEADSHGYPWCPSDPPPWIFAQEINPIYGIITTSQKTVTPPSQTRVVWLDCSKPLRSVKVNMCHSTTSSVLPIASITHNVVDRSSSSFGPDCISQSNDTSGVNGHPWCHYAYDGAAAGELQKSQHYSTETWEVGRSRLTTLPLWISVRGALTGLQYVADNGRMSPVWGSSRMGCPVEVDLPRSNGTGSAMKFFLESDERNDKGVDFMVVAVQVLSIEIEKEDEPEPWRKELIASLGPR